MNAPLLNKVFPTNDFLLEMGISVEKKAYRPDCACWWCEGVRYRFNYYQEKLDNTNELVIFES